MAILVTGAAGFVGLNLLDTLLSRGGEPVVGFDTLPLPPRAAREFAERPGRLTMVQGDIGEESALDTAFAAAPVTAVIHAAVITAGTERERSAPERIAEVNVGGAIAVLRAALRHGVRRFLYISSGSVYGEPPADGGPYDEATTWPRPLALYGITKLAAEQAVLRLAALEGLSAAVARLGSVFGPWEWATGVRDTLSPALQALDAFACDGEAVLGPVNAVDHVYSRDVAEALAGLLATPAQGVFNIGRGTITDAADICRALAKASPEFRWRMAAPGEAFNVTTHMPRRPGMALQRIKSATGWQARFDLDTAAKDLLAWRSA
ncbi:NAD-dependent epimerase/dehydratase family protein [Siccirubricoccus phaeus]|uniref:NAD-dependent epimerase/dehydratase family protein n=1 Tax=Siccirubricoccus phaeus TaxID=2595053 RepID=UPI0011F3E3AA|nr:NAD(P)-dependent oxidoreductase [Siccirubricoccus phaeus]